MSRGSALIAGPQLFGINSELRQGCDSEQAGAVRIGHNRTQAGKEVSGFGHIHHIHVLDGERNTLARQLGGQLIAMTSGCGKVQRSRSSGGASSVANRAVR